MYRNCMPLVLASASPRRQELLSRMGLRFDVIPSSIEENEAALGDPWQGARLCARKKAEAVAGRMQNGGDAWFLGVDTIVVLDREILGKPRDREEARNFLRKLSGRRHRVISGYCLYRPQASDRVENAVGSEVTLRAMAPAEIEAYLDTDEPYDKAGAYAAQGIGASLVETITGSYTNVVGLPLAELVRDLLRCGVIEPGPGNG